MNIKSASTILTANIKTLTGVAKASVKTKNGGTLLDADASSFITTAGITDESIKTALYTLYGSLKSNSLYSKIYEFLPIVGGTSGSHAVFGKNPARTLVTWTGSPTHNSSGVTGNGSSQYGRLNWNPVTEGASLTSFGFGIYKGVTPTVSRMYTGIRDSSFNMTVLQTGGTSKNAGFIAGYQFSDIVSTGTGTGNFLFIKTDGSRSARISADGVYKAAFTQTLTSFPSLGFYLLAVSNNGSVYQPAATTAKFWIATQGLSDTQVATLSTIITQFQTDLGRA